MIRLCSFWKMTRRRAIGTSKSKRNLCRAVADTVSRMWTSNKTDRTNMYHARGQGVRKGCRHSVFKKTTNE